MSTPLTVAVPESPVLSALLARLRERVTETGHRLALPGGEEEADILVLTPRAAPPALGGRLRAVLFPTIGVDPLDVPSATAAGIVVAHSAPHESVASMAEATVALMLSLFAGLDRKQAILRAGNWREPGGVGRMLRGSTVGLVGFGRIGRAVAALLQPFGVTILFHDRLLADQGSLPLAELLAQSDIVSLHTSREAGASPLIGRAEISVMKPDAYLVNTARGRLVEEDALCEALAAGRLAGAALDAFEHEPLAGDSPLRGAPNLILTPHNVGHTAELMAALEREALRNLYCLLDGRPPATVFNPDVLPRWTARFGGAT